MQDEDIGRSARLVVYGFCLSVRWCSQVMVGGATRLTDRAFDHRTNFMKHVIPPRARKRGEHEFPSIEHDGRSAEKRHESRGIQAHLLVGVRGSVRAN